MTFLVVVAFWLACSVLVYGLVFAAFTKPFGDVRGGMGFGILLGVYGPFGLVIYGALATFNKEFRHWPAYRYTGKRLDW